jgi:hypothetical protein
MRHQIRDIITRYRFWFLFVFVALNALLLFLVFRHETVSYPSGWDAPYYINRIREFIERGIIPHRFGFVIAMGIIHLVTRIPVITTVAWASPVLMVLTATGVASLVYAASRKSLLGFCLAFAVTLWSPLNVLLSTGTFDNAFAVALLFFALWIVRWAGPSWRRGIALLIVSSIIGGTHLETYALFVVIVALYEALQLVRHRSLKRWWMREFDVFAAMLLALLISVLHWAGTLNTLVTFYTTTAGSGGNASIPYAQSSTLTSVLNYLQTGIANTTVLSVVLMAVLVLIYRVIRRRDAGADIFIAYVIASYGVLLYAVLRGSIPINRAILVVPINALIGFGIYLVTRFPKRLRLTFGALVIITFYLAVATPTALVATVRRLSPSISPTTFTAYHSLAEYVRDHDVKTYVVIADIPNTELAASAYYSLWTNWLVATKPTGTTTDQFCIYLGSLANYRSGVPATRTDRQEYNDTAREGQRCVSALAYAFPTEPPATFVIQGIYFASFSQPAWSATNEVIGPNLGRIHLPPSTTRALQ